MPTEIVVVFCVLCWKYSRCHFYPPHWPYTAPSLAPGNTAGWDGRHIFLSKKLSQFSLFHSIFEKKAELQLKLIYCVDQLGGCNAFFLPFFSLLVNTHDSQWTRLIEPIFLLHNLQHNRNRMTCKDVLRRKLFLAISFCNLFMVYC